MENSYLKINRFTHYDTLGLKSDAKDSEIRTAYKKKALEYHPVIIF